MYTLHDVGDQALLVEFENEISMEVNRKVVALKRALEERRLPGIGELIPTYRSLVIHYDPLTADLDQLKQAIDQGVKHLDLSSLPKSIVTEIPVLYEGEYALDLEEIARIEGKTEEEIIRIHSQSDYYVYMLGFAPGHPYTARFENPFSFKRRETPGTHSRRQHRGAAGPERHHPFDQPCGWNIIGTTPILACDYRKKNPFLLKAGQWIRHVPVDKAEFMDIKRQVELGCYQPKTYEKEG